jgi:type 1 glutamine amidotransferase
MLSNRFLCRRTFLGASTAVAGMFAAPGVFADESRRKLVMLAGRPSHGPMEHEFNAGVLLLRKCLERIPGLQIEHHRNGWPDSEKAFDGASGILLYADGGAGHPFIQDARLAIVGDLMRRGVGLMCVHFAVEVPANKGGKEFQDWLGGYYEHKWSCNPMWTPDFTDLPEHPITRGVKPFSIRDEWYFNMRFRPEMKDITPILSAKPSDAVRDGPYVYPRGPYEHVQKAKGSKEVMMWAVERKDGGRGVGFTGGHFHRNWSNDNFRKVVLNAALWICKADVPRQGVPSTVMEADIRENLDPKGPRDK